MPGNMVALDLCNNDKAASSWHERDINHEIPTILRLDDIDEPPEIYWTWYRPLALLFVVCVICLFVGLTLCFLPLLVIASLVRAYLVRRLTYHTHPKDIRIAIVGGGWSGLQIIDRLLELGVTQIQGYERWDDIGGTWNPKAAYFNQAIHAPMYMSSFANHPYHDPNCKLRADQLQLYLKEFCEKKDLRKFYKFNANVKVIHYDQNSNKATLEIQYNDNSKEAKTTTKNQQEIEEPIPFDLVIFTSFNSEPHIPVFEGQTEFEGEILHSQKFTKEVFYSILKEQKKIAVIGGGKTSVDLLFSFQKAGYNQISWVYRNPYMFSKMEFVFSAPSIRKIFLGMSFIVTVFSTLISNRLANWLMWCTGSVWTYDNSPKNGYKFKAGQLDNNQRRVMNEFDPNKKYQSGVRRFEPKGIRLEDGRFVEADIVLLATSAKSGLHSLRFTKDGAPFVFDLNERMLNSFIVPSFPILGLHFCTLTYGPQRSRASGDLAVYHCCVQANPIPVPMARRIQRLQYIDSRRARAIFHAWDDLSENGILFILCSNAISFILSGMVDFFNIIIHTVKLLCFARQDPFDLNILPPLSIPNKL